MPPTARIHLVTAIYGGYDSPVAPVRQPDVDSYQLVTDDPNAVAPPWITIPRWVLADPRHAARYPKFTPSSSLTMVYPGDIVVWVDGRVAVTSPGFVAWGVEALGDADVAVWPHEARSSTAAEASAAAVEMPAKYSEADLAAHVASHAGQPDDELWRLTVMFTRVSDRTHQMGLDVLAAMARFSRSIDQVEFPHACREHSVEVVALPGTIWDHSDKVHLQHHRDGT